MTTEMLDAARRYVAAGLSVIPIRRWSKWPDHQLLEVTTGQPVNYSPSDLRASWRIYAEHMPTDAELERWFRDSDCGIGIVGGQVSGGLVRLDFEHQACLTTWYSLLSEDRDLFAAAAALPVVQTGKGHHIYFRMTDPPGHVVLCAHGTGDEGIVFSETQGEGCYCLAPPTKHINDRGEEFSYMWVSRCGFEAIPTLDQELAQKLIAAARFPDFWEPTFAAPWGARAGEVSRNGLSLFSAPKKDGGYQGLWLNWPHLAALRAYLDRYEGLLRAVETAPPPPPSYVEDDSDGWL
jgi:hypothetical protein